MQTFLPLQNYEETAKCLDRVRLGKQRVECLQILKALTDSNYGWQNHPAVNMWRGLEHYLYQYTKAICNEWRNRGYKDTCFEKFVLIYLDKVKKINNVSPFWKDDLELFDSHKSNLIRKNSEHYKKFNWSVASDLDYKWYKK